VEIGILGPLRVVGEGGRRWPITAHKIRILLANLLIERDQVVPARKLIDELWNGGSPPRTARTGVQVYVSTLRKTLRRAGLTPGIADILTEAPGYTIQVRADLVDSTRFDQAIQSAKHAETDGDKRSASQHLAEALSYWRGPALADVRDTPQLAAAARRLDESRIAAYEKRVRIDFDLGRSEELIGELYSYVAEYPLHERLREYLMTALYDGGRPADALDVYRTYRSAMLDMAGVEPGTRLRQLRQIVLARQPLEDELHPDGDTATYRFR
jgi:SARP family transcriptional regulator, regulator of embCAB operon